MDSRLAAMQAKMDAITGVYDDLHEKMHEIDKTRRNNLMIHGVKPDFTPEHPQELERKIQELIRWEELLRVGEEQVGNYYELSLSQVYTRNFKGDPGHEGDEAAHRTGGNLNC